MTVIIWAGSDAVGIDKHLHGSPPLVGLHHDLSAIAGIRIEGCDYERPCIEERQRYVMTFALGVADIDRLIKHPYAEVSAKFMNLMDPVSKRSMFILGLKVQGVWTT
ncbi:hypothetical protein [Altererythrobacter fulvus]|uniref:hypothetical protein n=1 Tax=Caenibius fulvus TaxID=2126012 RepID=UPI003016FEEC